MQVLEAAAARTANPWPLRRERAAELAERYPHAAEMLRLYHALTVVQEAAFDEARANLPSPARGREQGGGFEEIANFAATKVLPSVVDATVSSGPSRLRDGVIAVFCGADLVNLVQRWLDGQPLTPVETYLARASASPLLEASAGSPHPALPQRGRVISECPACGGLPQLSYFAVSGEALVSGPRYLVCSRCANNWVFSRMTCAGCGESTGTKLPIYQEQERFPHVRVDGCQTCRKYLLTFDLRRETRAVPIVDEIAALPLDLFARNQGLTKITPNLMGN
ncbi:MAG TPA: formate dehydrogenase accessory protein FdhE [Candidatus Dormibacteraeota bacterium]